MQQIAASLEDKMTIKMNKMLNEMKALVVTTPAPVKAVEEAIPTKLQVQVLYLAITFQYPGIDSSNYNSGEEEGLEVNSRGLHQDGKEKTVISSDLTSSHLKRRHVSHGESTLIGVHKPIQRPTIDAQMIKGNGRQRLND
ncbi:hypothetical protein Tco_1059684 [Tanacetum coccineum]